MLVEVNVWMFCICLIAIGSACVTCYLMAICSILSRQVTKAATQLENCASDFEKLSKIASESNLSLATKVTELESRIDAVDAWRSMQGLSGSVPPMWKK